jgi:hypothetical protein
MIYKKVARAADEAALEETAHEIADRFGEPPEALRRLYEYARLRLCAERVGVTSITRQAGRVHVRFGEGAAVDPARVLELVRQTPGAALSPGGVLTLPSPEDDRLLPALRGLLAAIEPSAVPVLRPLFRLVGLSPPREFPAGTRRAHSDPEGIRPWARLEKPLQGGIALVLYGCSDQPGFDGPRGEPSASGLSVRLHASRGASG